MAILIHQLLGFIATGAISALIDLAIYNALTGRSVRWPRVPAHLASVAIAMAFSFTANAWLVFQAPAEHTLTRLLKFCLVTCTSAFVLQSLVIHALSRLWRRRLCPMLAAASRLPLARLRESDVLERNLAKGAAMGVGLIWNFLFYRCCVFS